MQGKDEWSKLKAVWEDAKVKAEIEQQQLDDQVEQFLDGKGECPTMAEVEEVEEKWSTVARAREIMDQSIKDRSNNNYKDNYEQNYGLRDPEKQIHGDK